MFCTIERACYDDNCSACIAFGAETLMHMSLLIAYRGFGGNRIEAGIVLKSLVHWVCGGCVGFVGWAKVLGLVGCDRPPGLVVAGCLLAHGLFRPCLEIWTKAGPWNKALKNKISSKLLLNPLCSLAAVGPFLF